jgi:hypothetical protein
MSNLFIVLGVLFVLSFVPLAFLFVRGYLRYRGERLVSCPQDGQLARVRLDAARAAVSSLTDSGDLPVTSCSRWPEHKDCRQGCVEAGASVPLAVPQTSAGR